VVDRHLAYAETVAAAALVAVVADFGRSLRSSGPCTVTASAATALDKILINLVTNSSNGARRVARARLPCC